MKKINKDEKIQEYLYNMIGSNEENKEILESVDESTRNNSSKEASKVFLKVISLYSFSESY